MTLLNIPLDWNQGTKEPSSQDDIGAGVGSRSPSELVRLRNVAVVVMATTLWQPSYQYRLASLSNIQHLIKRLSIRQTDYQCIMTVLVLK